MPPPTSISTSSSHLQSISASCHFSLPPIQLISASIRSKYIDYASSNSSISTYYCISWFSRSHHQILQITPILCINLVILSVWHPCDWAYGIHAILLQFHAILLQILPDQSTGPDMWSCDRNSVVSSLHLRLCFLRCYCLVMLMVYYWLLDCYCLLIFNFEIRHGFDSDQTCDHLRSDMDSTMFSHVELITLFLLLSWLIAVELSCLLWLLLLNFDWLLLHLILILVVELLIELLMLIFLVQCWLVPCSVLISLVWAGILIWVVWGRSCSSYGCSFPLFFLMIFMCKLQCCTLLLLLRFADLHPRWFHV